MTQEENSPKSEDPALRMSRTGAHARSKETDSPGPRARAFLVTSVKILFVNRIQAIN